LIGLALGLLGSFALTRLTKSLLFGVGAAVLFTHSDSSFSGRLALVLFEMDTAN